MTNPLSFSRKVICARCGSEFCCGLSKECWCAAETARHPLPSGGTGFDDCLCQACLRAIAAEHEAASRTQRIAFALSHDRSFMAMMTEVSRIEIAFEMISGQSGSAMP